VAEGEALVTQQAISGWGGVDPMSGTIIESRHELRGQSFKDKVLVFPGAKGSSGWSAIFHLSRRAEVRPKAMVFNVMTTKVASLGLKFLSGSGIVDIAQPLEVIRTGDWVRWTATTGPSGREAGRREQRRRPALVRDREDPRRLVH
jgi:predicted aconitase with swiveling domain